MEAWLCTVSLVLLVVMCWIWPPVFTFVSVLIFWARAYALVISLSQCLGRDMLLIVVIIETVDVARKILEVENGT